MFPTGSLFKRHNPSREINLPSLKQAFLFVFFFCFNVISGCDDLLPILSFVIIRSGMAQLVSECDAMEEFIPEG